MSCAMGLRGVVLAAALNSTALVGELLGGTIHNVPADFVTIQACIDASQDGDECVVAPGTYHQLIDFHGKAITVRGVGGSEVTIVDAGSAIDPGDGKPVVRCDSGEGAGTVLVGFTLTGGTGDTVVYPYSVGGGMFNSGSNPKVIDCVFAGNEAVEGGGMFNDQSSPTVTACVFIENHANSGAGMFNDAGHPTVVGCAFTDNAASGTGGGMYNTAESRPDLFGCTLTGNSAGFDGGGMANINSHPTLRDCVFDGNSATLSGGGMSNNLGSRPTLADCTFAGNVADFRGGGMYCVAQSHASVIRCTFNLNTSGAGGGIGIHTSSPIVIDTTFSCNTAAGGGGVYNWTGRPALTNCAFLGNLAHGAGGGMFSFDNSHAVVTNSTFVGNTAGTHGGALSMHSATMTVLNSTFSGNLAVVVAGAIHSVNGSSTVTNSILWGDSPNEVAMATSTSTFAFCDVQGSGGSGNWDVSLGGDAGGNVDADPTFVRAPDAGANGWDRVDDDYGNVRLLAASPCSNAGNAELLPVDDADLDADGDTDEPLPIDFDGHARSLCGQVDAGAHESGMGDFDCDGQIGSGDVGSWASCMTGPHGGSYEADCRAFDFALDGDVDLTDWASFLSIFSGS